MDDIFETCATEFLRAGKRSLSREVDRRLDRIEELLAAGASWADVRAMLHQAGIASTAHGFRAAMARARRRRAALPRGVAPDRSSPTPEQVPAAASASASASASAPTPAPAPAPKAPAPQCLDGGGVRPPGDEIPPGPAQLDAVLRKPIDWWQLECQGRRWLEEQKAAERKARAEAAAAKKTP